MTVDFAVDAVNLILERLDRMVDALERIADASEVSVTETEER